MDDCRRVECTSLVCAAMGEELFVLEKGGPMSNSLFSSSDYPEIVSSLTLPSCEVFCVSCDRSGTYLSCGVSDGSIFLWTLNDWSRITLSGHESAVCSVCFSPNGQLLVSGSADHSVCLWSVHHGLVRSYSGHKGAVKSVCFSPDGNFIASGSFDSTVCIWNVGEDGRLRGKLTSRHPVYGVAFSPDGRVLASCSSGSTVSLWNVDEMSNIRTFSVGNPEGGLVSMRPVQHVEFLGVNSLLATASDNSFVSFWDANNKRRSLGSMRWHPSAVTTMSFSLDYSHMVVGYLDGSVGVGNMFVEEHVELNGISQRKRINSVCCCDRGDERFIVVAEGGVSNNSVQLWRVSGGCKMKAVENVGCVDTMCLSSDESLFGVVCNDRHVVYIYETKSGHRLRTLDGLQSRIDSITFSSNALLLCVACETEIQLWDVCNGTCIRVHLVDSVDSNCFRLENDDKVLRYGDETDMTLDVEQDIRYLEEEGRRKKRLQVSAYSVKCMDETCVVEGGGVFHLHLRETDNHLEDSIPPESFHFVTRPSTDEEESRFSNDYTLCWSPKKAGRYECEVLGDIDGDEQLSLDKLEVTVIPSSLYTTKILLNEECLECVAGEEIVVYVHGMDKYNNMIEKGGEGHMMKLSHSSDIVSSVTDLTNGQYNIQFSSEKSGVHECSLCVDGGDEVKFHLTIKPSALSLSLCCVDFPEIFLFQEAQIKVVGFDQYENRCKIEQQFELRVACDTVHSEAGDDGTAVFHFTPQSYGNHEVVVSHENGEVLNKVVKVHGYREWTKEHVAEWVKSGKFSKYADNFDVTGEALVEMGTARLTNELLFIRADAELFVDELGELRKMRSVNGDFSGFGNQESVVYILDELKSMREEISDLPKEADLGKIISLINAHEKDPKREEFENEMRQNHGVLYGCVKDILRSLRRKSLILNLLYYEKDDKKTDKKKGKNEEEPFECAIGKSERGLSYFHSRPVEYRRLDFYITSDDNTGFKVLECTSIKIGAFERINEKGDVTAKHDDDQELNFETLSDPSTERIGTVHVQAYLLELKGLHLIEIEGNNQIVSCKVKLTVKVKDDKENEDVLNVEHHIGFFVHKKGTTRKDVQSDGKERQLKDRMDSRDYEPLKTSGRAARWAGRFVKGLVIVLAAL